MSKEYGLILSGQQKKTAPPARPTAIARPSIFDESSDNSDDNTVAPSHLKAKATAPMAAPGLMERRIARRVQEKALEEDPTVFQYDEHYDKMETQREEESQSKCKEPKKPKYIGRLMEFAERRKLENELRVERQVQKDREEEGEQFKGKESFVTSAYRKKLEEMRQLEKEGKRDDYLEAIGDVTKQKDLDGFYRHLYEQKLGTAKTVTKPVVQKSDSEEEVAYKPIKSGKPKQRAYRKRRSSDEEDEETQSADVPAVAVAKKVHLTNNIDADSDFSIDSSTDDENDEDVQKNLNASKSKLAEKTAASATQVDSKKTALNFEKMQKETSVDAKKSETEEKTKDSMPPPPTASILPALAEPLIAKRKRDKSEIWKKRTVGDALVAAMQRYNERKAARNA